MRLVVVVVCLTVDEVVVEIGEKADAAARRTDAVRRDERGAMFAVRLR